MLEQTQSERSLNYSLWLNMNPRDVYNLIQQILKLSHKDNKIVLTLALILAIRTMLPPPWGIMFCAASWAVKNAPWMLISYKHFIWSKGYLFNKVWCVSRGHLWLCSEFIDYSDTHVPIPHIPSSSLPLLSPPQSPKWTCLTIQSFHLSILLFSLLAVVLYSTCTGWFGVPLKRNESLLSLCCTCLSSVSSFVHQCFI